MKTPPLLIAAALLFWGLAHGPVTLVAAVILGLLIEGSRWMPWRWDLPEARMISLGNVCLIILGGTFAMFYSEAREEAVGMLFTWMPVILAPLMVAQAYSVKERTSVRVFFPSLRWQARNARKAGIEPAPDPEIDVGYWYFAVALIAATSANTSATWLFVVLAVVLSAALLLDPCSGVGNRPEKGGTRQESGLGGKPHAHPALVGGVLLIVIAGGWCGPFALFGLQRWIEQLPWVPRDLGAADLGLSNTRIGDFYALKESGKILYRVKSRDGSPMPTLLQEASYSDYFGGIWRAASSELTEEKEAVPQTQGGGEMDLSIWNLQTGADGRLIPGAWSIELTGNLKDKKKGEGHFPLPAGTTRLWELPATMVTYNGYGTVQVDGANSPYRIHADYSPHTRLDGAPRGVDLDEWLHYQLIRDTATVGRQARQEGMVEAFETEMETIRQVAEDLQLAELPEKERVLRIHEYFRDNFRYSLNLERPSRYNSDQPLTEFLTRLKRGHCEYFATTTVLLLRAAGIPARYVVGFSVQEYNPWEKAWVVRSMHGHAWAMAYLGGQRVVAEDGTESWEGGTWVDVDTTPASWSTEDASGLPTWQPLTDFFANLWHQFELWRADGGFQKLRPYIPWVMGLALLIVGGGSLFGQTRRQRRKRKKGDEDARQIVIPHELQRLEAALAKRGYARGTGETSAHWLRRLASIGLPGWDTALAQKLIDVHYRDRFSPASISTEERLAFRQQVEDVLSAAG